MKVPEPILVTREPLDSDHNPYEPLSRLGYRLYFVPVTRTVGPADPAPLVSAVDSLSSYDWVAFTSARAVRGFAECARERGVEMVAERGSCHWSCVGEATARAFREAIGFEADLVSAVPNAAGLARALVERISPGSEAGGFVPRDGGPGAADGAGPVDSLAPGRTPASARTPVSARILFPAAAAAHPDLPRILGEAGVEVHQVEVYRVVPDAPSGDQLLPPSGRPHWASIILTSGTATRVLLDTLASVIPDSDRLREFVTSSRPAVLGDTAARALSERGIQVWLQASSPSVELLVQEMIPRL